MPVDSGIYWEAHGPIDAPVLLLASGLGGSAYYWMPNLAALTERFRVLVYDQRGAGRSDRAFPETVAVADFADDILMVLDAAGLGSFARHIEDWGAVRAIDQLNLDGLLALWHPSASN